MAQQYDQLKAQMQQLKAEQRGAQQLKAAEREVRSLKAWALVLCVCAAALPPALFFER